MTKKIVGLFSYVFPPLFVGRLHGDDSWIGRPTVRDRHRDGKERTGGGKNETPGRSHFIQEKDQGTGGQPSLQVRDRQTDRG